MPETGGLVLIDDEELSAALNRSIFEEPGYDIRAFAWSPEVFDQLVSDEPIVFETDFDMPEISGLELAE